MRTVLLPKVLNIRILSYAKAGTAGSGLSVSAKGCASFEFRGNQVYPGTLIWHPISLWHGVLYLERQRSMLYLPVFDGGQTGILRE